MDGYNWGTVGAWHSWTPFASLFGSTYQAILGITYKPMMIAETASTEVGGNKAAWITDAFTTQLVNNFPTLKPLSGLILTKKQIGELSLLLLLKLLLPQQCIRVRTRQTGMDL